VSTNPLHTLRRHRDFRRLWISAVLSDLGTWMQAVTVSVLVAASSKSSGATALVFTSLFIPQGLLSPLGGLVADRFDRRKVAMVLQWVQAVLAGGLAVAIAAGVRSALALSAIVLVQGVANALNQPAYSAMIPLMVPKEELLGALSLAGMTWNTGRAVGPALAALATTLWGPAASIAGNAVSFAVMALLLMLIRTPMHGGGSVDLGQAHREIKAGARLTMETPGPRAMVATTVMFHLCMGFFFSTIPTYAAVVDHWPRLPMVLYASMGVGALIGASVVATMVARIGRSRVLTMLPLMAAVSMTLAAHAHSAALAAVALAGFGASSPVSFISAGAVVQRDAPEAFRGRIVSIYAAVVGLGFGIFSIADGFLADKVFGLRNTLQIGAIALALVVVALNTVWRSWRRTVNGPDPLPSWRPETLPSLRHSSAVATAD
jgi:MFS family permease